MLRAMARHLTLDQSAAALHAGGLIVYPTEAVWGLGCDPFSEAALRRLLQAKQRSEAKGLILIAADLAQVEPLVDFDALPPARREAVLASWPGPHTWLLPCRDAAPPLLRGEHRTQAIRITAHPLAAALCRAFGGPLVSTSANLSGQPAVRHQAELDPALLALVDGLLPGATGGLERPTPVRDALTGEVLRA